MVSRQAGKKWEGEACRTNGMLRIAVSIFAAMLLLYEPADSVKAGSPTEAVRGAVDEVMRILADKELKQPERARERRELVEKIIEKRLDFEEMAKRTLGLHWRELNDTERKEFVSLFKRFLSTTYQATFEQYSDEQVQYLSEQVKGDFAQVRTKVVSSKLEVQLDFRLIRKTDEWWVYDLVADGVSLARNYRAQFIRIIRSSSYKALLDKLRNKADQIKAPL